MENENMNISEAFKHLLDGKKIKHKDIDNHIYWLLGNKIAIYHGSFQNGDKKDIFYTLAFTEFRIDDNRLNNWMVVDELYNIRFAEHAAITVPRLIKNGYTLKRLKTGKRYNNTDLSDCGFTIEDMEASDWVVEDL